MHLFLVWDGLPQTLGAYADATTLEGAKQTIALGPVASQVAIKMLGTNGGGFFNANAAHPFENATALGNFVQMISIFALGAALTNVFGRMVGDERQGWAILAAMGILFVAGVAVTYGSEAAGNPLLHALGVGGGNMEGKEVRFGIAASSLFAVITTAASCGAVNAMHDSFTALGGMIPLINMELGEIIVGGVGCGSLRHAGLRDRGDLRCRPDGRPHAGISRQEDRGEGGQDGHARHPLPAAGHARLHCGRDNRPLRRLCNRQSRSARLLGDPLRLHICGGEQWVGLCRSVGQHALVQRDAGDHDAGRPVLRDRPGAGDRRLACGEEDGARIGSAHFRRMAGCSSACSSA